MLLFGEKNTFIFFKYIWIYKDVLGLFHYKDKKISHVPKENSTELPLGMDFMKFWL